MVIPLRFIAKTDQIDVSFAYDYDCDLHMLSKDPDAKSWKVIVHCKDGEKHVALPCKFLPYPGCVTHEGEVAWLVEYFFHAEKIEIQRPGLENVIVRHPDTEKKSPGINPPKKRI